MQQLTTSQPQLHLQFSVCTVSFLDSIKQDKDSYSKEAAHPFRTQGSTLGNLFIVQASAFEKAKSCLKYNLVSGCKGVAKYQRGTR